MRVRSVLELRALSEAGAGEIEHWFDHPEVDRRLGPRGWIHRAVRLVRDTRAGEEFRGRIVLRAHGWVVVENEAAVAYVGGDVYDRWTDGSRGVCMGLGYVVDPARWRRGYGVAALRAVVEHAETADVVRFYCGIDADNLASRRCAVAAGFTLVDPVPDDEDMLYFRLARDLT